MNWVELKCKGDIPPGLYGHTASLVGSKMFIFGGRGAGGVTFKDVYALDVTCWRWTRVRTTTATPCARFGHAQALVGHKLVVFGGWDAARCFNDLWIFDTTTATWTEPRVDGKPPTPRQGHSMLLLPSGGLLVFGGSAARAGGGFEFVASMGELDTETMTWGRPRVSGALPLPRAAHTAVLVGHQVVTFGGWRGVKRCVLCGVPSNMAKPADSALQHQPDCIVGKSLAAAQAAKGGAPPAPSAVDYLMCFDTEEAEWFTPDFRGVVPSSR
jgi:hypothetical protein